MVSFFFFYLLAKYKAYYFIQKKSAFNKGFIVSNFAVQNRGLVPKM